MNYRLLSCARMLCVLVLSGAVGGCLPLSHGSHTFTTDGLELHYYDVGHSEPLILLHGFAMSGRLQWGGLADELSEVYRLIIPDHRGHGDSDAPVGADQYGMRMVDDVLRLMDHLRIDRARVAGMSMGGFMTVSAVLHHPDRFRCGFVGAAGWADPLRADALSREDMALAFERGEGFDRLDERLNPGSDGPGWLGQLFFHLLIGRQDPLVLASVYRGMSGFQVNRSLLERNERSLLVVIGDEDGLLPAARSLAEVAPAARLEVLDGNDHGSVGSDPRFAAAMKDFFADDRLCGSPDAERS